MALFVTAAQIWSHQKPELFRKSSLRAVAFDIAEADKDTAVD